MPGVLTYLLYLLSKPNIPKHVFLRLQRYGYFSIFATLRTISRCFLLKRA